MLVHHGSVPPRPTNRCHLHAKPPSSPSAVGKNLKSVVRSPNGGWMQNGLANLELYLHGKQPAKAKRHHLSRWVLDCSIGCPHRLPISAHLTHPIHQTTMQAENQQRT